MTNANPSTQLMDIATRIRGMRGILGYRIGPFEIESNIMELPKTISGKIQRNKL